MTLANDINKAYEFTKEGRLSPVSRDVFIRSLSVLNVTVERKQLDSWFEQHYMAWRYVERWVLSREGETKILLVVARLPTANSENCVWFLP